MDFLQNWVGRICTVTLIVAICGALTPKNSSGRIVCLIGTLIMTVVIISPFKKIDISQISAYSREYAQDLEGKINVMQETNEKTKEALIEERLATYILQRTSQMGVACKVMVLCEDGVPSSVSVITSDSTKNADLRKMIENECGIKRINFSVGKV